MKLKITKKQIIFILSVTLLLSALLYNLLYINKEKNLIIEEIQEPEENEINLEEKAEKRIFIDVAGEVNAPGLYSFLEGARVNDAIFVAGGLTENADTTNVNLAYVLSDGLKLTIPKKEVKLVKIVAKPQISAAMVTNSTADDGFININTATKEQLKTLTGIGESTAQKILDFRATNGCFNKKEDIKNVSGIGEQKYKSIENRITV